MYTKIGLLLAGAFLFPFSPAAADEPAYRCAAHSSECGYPDVSPADPYVAPVPDLPAKCWTKKYRKRHKEQCLNYAYWKNLVGDAR